MSIAIFFQMTSFVPARFLLICASQSPSAIAELLVCCSPDGLEVGTRWQTMYAIRRLAKRFLAIIKDILVCVVLEHVIALQAFA